MNDRLEHRLSNLPLPMPPALVPATLAAASRPKAVAAAPSRRLRRAIRPATSLALGVVMLFGANLVGVHVSPSYRAALADAPVLGQPTMGLLQDLGLAGPSASPSGSNVNPGVTPLAVSTTVTGVSVGLVAGYADNIRTVLIIQAPDNLVPFPADGPNHAVLTDRAGRSYPQVAVNGAGTYGGQTILNFPVLPAGAGAQLSLTVPAMYTDSPKAPLVSVAGYPSGTKGEFPGPVVVGPWKFSFTLPVSAGQQLAIPAPQTVDGTSIAITDIRQSGRFVDVQWTETGGIISQRVAFNGAKLPLETGGSPLPNPYADPTLHFASGALVPQGSIVEGTESFRVGSSTPTEYGDYLYRLPKAGVYRLVFGSLSSVSFTINVT